MNEHRKTTSESTEEAHQQATEAYETLCELETTKSQRYICVYHVTLCSQSQVYV